MTLSGQAIAALRVLARALDKERDMMDRFVAVLSEFVDDIEAADAHYVRKDWPDLYVTYQKAKKILAQEEKSNG